MIERLPGQERKEGEEEVERNLCPFGCVCVCVKDEDTCLVGCAVGCLVWGDGIITAYGVGKGPKVKRSSRDSIIYLQGMKRIRGRGYQKVENNG